MPAATRAKEAERVSVAYQIALTKIGAETIEDAIDLWDKVPPTASPATVAKWLGGAIRLIMTRRSRARDLGLAYYRLVRALRTGKTVADPRRPEPRFVPISKLRKEFEELANEKLGDQAGGGDTKVEVEKIPEVAAEETRQERAAEQEARTSLIRTGPVVLRTKLEQVDTSEPAEKVDEQRRDAHAAAGRQQAGTSERVVLDGARGTVWRYAQRDKRVIGYVRLSRTGTPCGWCAMLISRGAVYKSKASATGKGRKAPSVVRGEYAEGDQYHNHCHCYAEPIYSKDQFRDSPLTELNRKYGALWGEVTKGKSGKEALAAWRKYIRDQQKKARAQEARQTTAQEA